MFLPGQFSRFYEASRRAEGSVYFVGEHLSRHHTWIAGAVDSAIQTVGDMLGVSEIRSLGEEYSRPKKGGVNVQRPCGQKRCSYSIPLHNNVQYVEDLESAWMAKNGRATAICSRT
jgi:hypothetical protein